nr:MAG TPA: hypothetical protein [Caudoviricetes sp.]
MSITFLLFVYIFYCTNLRKTLIFYNVFICYYKLL